MERSIDIKDCQLGWVVSGLRLGPELFRVVEMGVPIIESGNERKSQTDLKKGV